MAEIVTFPTQKQTWPEPGAWTYDDYLKLPDDGRRYEIIEGVLYVTNAPGLDHQFTVMEIAFHMKRYISEQKLGYVLTAPFEVHLTNHTRPVQPDVMFIRAERWPQPGAKFFEGAPDLIVEVLSSSTSRTDQFVKFNAYEQAGVPEYWIVNPKTRSAQVFTLSGQEYALVGEFIGEEISHSKILPGLQIITHTLFNTNS